MAKVLKVDHYTTNPVLDQKLNEFAWVVWAVEFGLNFGINMVPGGMARHLRRVHAGSPWLLIQDLTEPAPDS